MLYGRDGERSVIDALLERVRTAGGGGGLVVHGDPGIGKTALLEYAAESATGMGVLRTVGVEPESDLTYAALHRLLLPVLDRIDRLPEPQARALSVVFGQAAGPAPDRFLVALATLSLLSEVAASRPVVCLVDDAHSCDAASQQVLAFVARRLEAEPIVLALAARDGEGRPPDTADLVDVPLSGLDRESARALIMEHTRHRLSDAGQEELLRATGGNPLAIRELSGTAWRTSGTGEPVPLAAGLQRAFLERARRQGRDAQEVLLLVAAAGAAPLATISRAAEARGVTAGPAVLHELRELIVEDGPTVTYRHPLIRSASYYGAGPHERREAHRALAAALQGEPAEADRRAWHLGRAAVGRDEKVAEELERSAERAMRRAGPGAAGSTLARAAELTVSETSRARRLVAAADACWQDGDAARAAALLDRAEHVPSPGDVPHREIAGLRASIEVRSGTPAEAVALLRPWLPDLLRTDRCRAVRLLLVFTRASLHANATEEWTAIAGVMEELSLSGEDAEDVLARLFRATCRVREGEDPGLAAGDLAAVERLTDPARLCWAGGMVRVVGHHELGSRLLHEAVRRARALGAAGVLAWALESLVTDELAGWRPRRPTRNRETAWPRKPARPTRPVPTEAGSPSSPHCAAESTRRGGWPRTC